MSDMISHKIQAMQQRLQALYRYAHREPQQQELLMKAFDELDHALEELQALENMVQQQQEELLDTRESLEAERQTFEELFEFAPAGYLITSPNGTIRRANETAVRMFKTDKKLMVGRSLALFIPDGERRQFRAAIEQLQQAEDIQEWEARMKSWGGASFDVLLSVATVRSEQGRPQTLRWIVRSAPSHHLHSRNNTAEQDAQTAAAH